VKPGDLVRLSSLARKWGVKTRDPGPWKVLRVREDGIVVVERISRRTGRPWPMYVAEKLLEVVEGEGVSEA